MQIGLGVCNGGRFHLDSTRDGYASTDTNSGASSVLQEETLRLQEYSSYNNQGNCKLPEAFKTSFVPHIIESYTNCRSEGSILESTLDEIYWNLHHDKTFGTERFKQLLEKRFAEVLMHNRRDWTLYLQSSISVSS